MAATEAMGMHLTLAYRLCISCFFLYCQSPHLLGVCLFGKHHPVDAICDRSALAPQLRLALFCYAGMGTLH